MTWVRPSWSTGGNGLPVATRARPSVQAIRSSGSASHREVGLDSGRMIGRSAAAVIVRTIGSLKAPGWVEVPIRIVGWARARSEEHTSELQSRQYLVCRLLLEKKKYATARTTLS